jgi:hypothetical protein
MVLVLPGGKLRFEFIKVAALTDDMTGFAQFQSRMFFEAAEVAHVEPCQIAGQSRVSALVLDSGQIQSMVNGSLWSCDR